MLSRIIFFTAVILATLAVVVLALFSPVVHRRPAQTSSSPRPWLALSLYIQPPQVATTNMRPVAAPPSEAAAFVFHHALTEGPENTSRIVGEAQGFIIPIQHFAHSAFNIIYLTFRTHQYWGSLSVQAKRVAHKDREELAVVGGTGSFAFARGLAVFVQTDHHATTASNAATYRIKLHLNFPNRSQTIPA